MVSDHPTASSRDPGELEHRVAEAIRAEPGLRELLSATLRLIARYAGWPVGHAYLIDDHGRVASSKVWFFDGQVRPARFVAASESSVFGPDDGVVGAVIKTGGPMWVPDVSLNESFFLRARPAAEAGLRSCVAFPLFAHGDVIGVFEFFDAELIELRDEMLPVLSRIGDMLGRAIARERTGQALRMSHEFMQNALGSAVDAFVAMDGEGVVLEWNEQAEVMFGWSRAEARGRPLAELIIPPPYRDDHHRGLDRYRRTGEGKLLNTKVDVQALHRDGHLVDVELVIWPVQDRGSTTFSAFLRSVAERKELEVALRQSERRLRDESERNRGEVEGLRDLDSMKNEILAAVSHELRTPLTSVLGLAETLQLWGDKLKHEQRSELAARIVANAKHLEGLLTDLMDVDRLKRGIVGPSFKRADVGALVRRVVTRTTSMLGVGRVTVAAPRAIVHIDAGKVERVVENLLVNAIKHTPPGTRVEVQVDQEDDGGVIISVLDEGPGVPDEEKSAIFEPFARGNGSRSTPGTGIGLSLVARFVALHNGRVWVEDRPGGGAVFRVVLPGDAVVDVTERVRARGAAEDRAAN